MTRCPDCDATVDPAASYCANCGATIDGSVSDAIRPLEEDQSDAEPTLELTDPAEGDGDTTTDGGGLGPTSGAVDDALADAAGIEDVDDPDDLSEMRELLELKRRREAQRIEAERERLAARDDVDPATLATLDETDATLAEIARIESDDVSEQRLRDQEAFREELRETMASTMDRMERLTERSIEELSGGDSGNESGADEAVDTDDAPTVTCPNCDTEQQAAASFCANCGRTLER